jgi:tetraacyldisaccharide 4'-kinase
VSAPVVCVGNLVAGGAGKTPVALALGEAAVALGHNPHFLSRGYGGRIAGPARVDPARHGAADAGDEPLLLAAVAPTWVAHDRAAAADAAVAAGAGLLIMDDGHQNSSLRKDLSLVVIDGEYGLGNGRVMPAGPLREPAAEGLARADVVVMMGEDRHAITDNAARWVPVVRARLMPTAWSQRLQDRAVLGFAGIGRPEKFFATLRALGCRVVDEQPFADHHAYSPDEIMQLVERAAVLGAVPVTTAKDHVRLPPEARPMVEVVDVVLDWVDPGAPAQLVERAVQACRARTHA